MRQRHRDFPKGQAMVDSPDLNSRAQGAGNLPTRERSRSLLRVSSSGLKRSEKDNFCEPVSARYAI